MADEAQETVAELPEDSVVEVASDGSAEVKDPEQQPAQEEFQSIRDAAGGLGYDLSSYETDESALQHLTDRSKEFDRQAETIRHYEQLLQQQQQPAQPQETQTQPDVPDWKWQPPPYNQSWLNQAERDPESGHLRPINGGSPGQVAQLQNFMDYRADQMDRFWTQGPHEYLKPYFDEQMAASTESIKEEVQRMIDASLGSQRAATEADMFLESNPWVYQRDANDQVVRNTITGNQELSEEGKMFAGYLKKAEEGGASPAFQKEYAMDMVERHRSQAPKGDAKKQDFLRAAAGLGPQADGSVTNLTPDADGHTPPQNSALSLEEMLRQNLKSEGITDSDFAETY